MTAKPKWVVIAAILGVIALAAVPHLVGPFTLIQIIRILFFGLLAVSFTFLSGQLGMESLTQTAFFGLAAYTIAISEVHYMIPFPQSFALAVAMAMGLAMIFGLLAIRTYGIYFLMITLALGQVMWGLAFQWISMTEGFDGIPGIRPPTVFGVSLADRRIFYYALLAVFVLVWLGLKKLLNSHFGLAMRGIRESRSRMAALGYPVSMIRYIAFVVAGAVAGLGGIFMAYNTGVVNPSAMDLSRSVWVLVVAVLGGVRWLEGAILGTAIVVFLEVVVSQYVSRYMVVIGTVFLLTVILAPDGLMGRVHSLMARSKSTKATV